MTIGNCYNTDDFRALAKRKLPAPIFHYIDGGADDEITLRRNTRAFDDVDLIPRVLCNVEHVDLSTTVMGCQLGMPLLLSPTALQRLFHHHGEHAVGKAAEAYRALFGISSLGTISIEEMAAAVTGPKMFQLYVHKDEGLTNSMIEKCKESRFDALVLTVDTVVGGNRERDLRTGFTSPPRLTAASLLSFARCPGWTYRYLTGKKFELSQLKDYVDEGSNVSLTVGDYFSTMLDQTLDWDRAAAIRNQWDGHFCLKGIMSVEDARRAVEIGATAIMVSNHGGRQLDGACAPFDQLADIVDAVGDQVDVICDGGIRRGTHVLKALAAGAKACSGGRFYLYALAAGGQPGVERALSLMRAELERGMKLMGVTRPSALNRSHLRIRRKSR